MTLDHSNKPGLASRMSDGDALARREHRPTTRAILATRDGSTTVAGSRYGAVRVMTPREQAETAWRPGARYSVAELEAFIRQYRRGTHA